ncbi:hypothetical protein BRADI_2g10580v3 [Brachypodium distachyon]|uniref:Uncharacterized protein n=1 Tax=Brachypodium distachyon TaxID=15368 RepID=I1HEI1_BRADI|nr:hypothetical protein BRADI_2g10580v3 [Brachypodium distachyon]
MDERLRVVRPRQPEFPGKDVREKERSQLLATIHDSYEKACEQHRLPVQEAAGFCLGLLDPASNLAVNAILINSDAEAGKAEDLERRSLNGMVVFLTTLFPCLADWVAVHYLLLAHADLLRAACLVLKDRAMETSPEHAGCMLKTALKCAALAARHPEPQLLVDAWLLLSSRLDDVIAAGADLSPVRLRGLITADDSEVDMVKPWEIAASRLDNITGVPYYHHTRSLRRALLDKIHRHYLQALAKLPRRDLRCRYHRGLLAAGSCYGPSDPVSNVILNTVWYEATFPARREQLEVDMISSNALIRAACRSLYGLVSFLCTRYGAGLSEHDAIRCLLDADADHHAAASDAERRGYRPCRSTQDAYEAAAIAAAHPDANAQAKFLGTAASPPLTLLCQDQDVLSSGDVLGLEELLSPVTPAAATKGENMNRALIRHFRYKFRTNEAKIVRKVKAALDEYVERSNEPGNAYELHVICGVNEFISGPDYDSTDSEDVEIYRYHRSHFNFLATSRSGGAPVLFFAECSNYDDQQPPLCRPVGVPPPRATLVRCLYCDDEGSKIVHPADSDFHGRDQEFEAMARAEKRFPHSNDKIISKSEYVGQRMCMLEEDSIHVDSDGASSGDDDINEILAELYM